MDYAKIASQVIELSGGKGNIRSVAHCATRLRLQLRNNDLRNEEAISDVEGEMCIRDRAVDFSSSLSRASAVVVLPAPVSPTRPRVSPAFRLRSPTFTA